jgi:4-alpha-glucanotransferase
VMVFFTDLLGMHDVYNRPGTIAEENWSLRIPPDFASRYEESRRTGHALDLPRALAIAFRARAGEFAATHRELLAALEERAGPDPAAT